MYLIGIDIGGTNLRAAVIEKDGKIIEVYKSKNEVDMGAAFNLDKLIDQIKNKWQTYEIERVGVGIPGPLNIQEGILYKVVNLRGWENFNVKQYMKEKLDLPVIVNNDANVAGLAESKIGSAKGCQSVFYITVSTGVGGALVLDNKIINGAHSQAAEIYNLIINEDSYSHNNANKGGLEGQCSGVSIERIASEIYGKPLTTKDVFALYQKNDEKIVEFIGKWVENLSIGIANIIAVIDPETIVLGGAVIINNPYLLPEIKAKVIEKVSDPSMVDIRIAQLGDNAGLIGAALL